MTGNHQLVFSRKWQLNVSAGSSVGEREAINDMPAVRQFKEDTWQGKHLHIKVFH